MKSVLKTGFSAQEKKILKMVTIYSVSICLTVVSGSWFYNNYKVKAETHTNLENQQSTLIPLDLSAHQFTAERYLQSGNPQKAIPHLQRILIYNKKDINNQITLAHAFLEAGEYQKAFDSYDRIEPQDLTDSIISALCTRKAIALYYLGKKDESKKQLVECLSKYPQTAEGYCFIAQIEAGSGEDSSKVQLLFEKAVQHDSSYVEAWYQLARYWMQYKKYYKAREYLLTAIHFDPLHSKSHARLGMIYYYLGNSELSRISYQTAIAINPWDFNTHYNLGELYYSRLDDTLNALKEFKNAVKEKPDHVEANFKIGLICMKNSMFKEAIHYFERALTQEPSNTRILLQLAVAFERVQQIEQARMVYKKILNIDELNSIANQKLKLLNIGS